MHIQREYAIRAPAETVWRCLTEFELRKRWMAQLVSEEVDQPENRGVGSVAIVRLLQRNQVVTYRSTVIDWEPCRKLSVGMTGGSLPPDLAIGVIYELSPGDAAETTLLKYDFHMPVQSFVLKLLMPCMRSAVGRIMDRDHAKLKALAESFGSETRGG
jgi:carbon monoxide dehydrogenase subunit G